MTDNYMYGDVEEDEYVDPSYLRQVLVQRFGDAFYGDNVEGLIAYCRKLEKYIIEG